MTLAWWPRARRSGREEVRADLALGQHPGQPLDFSSVLVAAATFVVTTLYGFLAGYESAVRRDVDRMGYDLLITAKAARMRRRPHAARGRVFATCQMAWLSGCAPTRRSWPPIRP